MLEPLAEEILNQLFSGTELYIPQYETVFRDVIARYQADPVEFGHSSYQYKLESGRTQNEPKVRIGYLSGTFDLFHIGHLNLLRRAKAECDYLIVGVHPNASHKGKETFIPFEERKAIVASIRYVDKVIESMPEDSDVWEKWHYTKLFVGSDYKGTERFNRYESFFSDKGVEIVYFPYTQGTSSTQLRERMTKDNS
jgi:glycerol-3-phosphate cytidylyltransferase